MQEELAYQPASTSDDQQEMAEAGEQVLQKVQSPIVTETKRRCAISWSDVLLEIRPTTYTLAFNNFLSTAFRQPGPSVTHGPAGPPISANRLAKDMASGSLLAAQHSAVDTFRQLMSVLLLLEAEDKDALLPPLGRLHQTLNERQEINVLKLSFEAIQTGSHYDFYDAFYWEDNIVRGMKRVIHHALGDDCVISSMAGEGTGT